MKPNDLPIVCLPLGLCDDDVATLLQFLHDLTETLERHYTREMRGRQSRWPAPTEDRSLPDPDDPPF
jgi:hypothetical protein